jgi:SAM-dependent methyltransferase
VLADYDRDGVARFNHLGHWDDPDDDPLAVPRVVAQQRMNDVLLGLAGVAHGARVLDVGSGFGGTVAAIDERFRDVTLVGLDIDDRQLEICARRVRPGPSNALGWVNASGTELPLRDAAFDAVLSIEAMWHFPSRAAFLAEAARVLRPGGRLAVVDLLIAPDASERTGMERAELVSTLAAGFDPWPEPDTTVEDLVTAAAAVGLTCTDHLDATANTRPTYLDHGDAEDRPGAAAFSANPGVRLFVQMHLAGSLSVHYLAFERVTEARP